MGSSAGFNKSVLKWNINTSADFLRHASTRNTYQCNSDEVLLTCQDSKIFATRDAVFKCC